jgi:hypothetical protein
MLPPFIIEQIRKREKEEREHQPPKEDEVDRGVVIVDLG